MATPKRLISRPLATDTNIDEDIKEHVLAQAFFLSFFLSLFLSFFLSFKSSYFVQDSTLLSHKEYHREKIMQTLNSLNGN